VRIKRIRKTFYLIVKHIGKTGEFLCAFFEMVLSIPETDRQSIDFYVEAVPQGRSSHGYPATRLSVAPKQKQ
jgi:hypothetical protein